MLVEASGKDVFKDMASKKSAGAKIFQSIPPAVANALMTGMVRFLKNLVTLSRLIAFMQVPVATAAAALLLPVSLPLRIASSYGAAVLSAETRRRLVRIGAIFLL